MVPVVVVTGQSRSGALNPVMIITGDGLCPILLGFPILKEILTFFILIYK